MKVPFWDEEWYPVFETAEQHGLKRSELYAPCFTIELTQEELDEFNDLHKRFKAWQLRLTKERT